MKRSAIVILFAVSVLAVNAQTGKGRIFLGGNLNFWSSGTSDIDTSGKTVSETDITQLGLNLRGGYFIVDNFAAGLIVGIDNRKEVTTNYLTAPTKNSDATTDNQFRYGIFGRYYNMIGESKLAFFAQLDVTLGSGKVTNEITSVTSFTTTVTKTPSERSSFNVGLAPGLAYFITDNFALEATIGNLGYSTVNWKYFHPNGRLKNEEKSSELNLSFSPSTIFLGLSFYFGGGGDGK